MPRSSFFLGGEREIYYYTANITVKCPHTRNTAASTGHIFLFFWRMKIPSQTVNAKIGTPTICKNTG
jgi:hypothetical protein